MIQEHDARRLHWDLRLEVDGVMPSWAVPRGPSLDPAERRLAVRTEDHPLSYADFEGRIPDGAYGAGQVIVWDEGRFVPEGDPAAGLGKGHLRFRLEGRRVRGGFSLVRRGAAGDAEHWLLIKHADDDALPGHRDRLVREHRGSVRTGRSTEQVDEDDALLERVAALPGATLRELPWPLAPHVPETGAPVHGAGWAHEAKWDGYRLLARKDHAKVSLRTRGGHDWTDRLPSIASAVAALPWASVVLDAELVWLGADGRPDFGRLQRSVGKADPHHFLMVFDVLAAAGFDLRATPWHARKALLRELLPTPGRLRRVDPVEGEHGTILARVCELGLEGVVSKRVDGPYRAGHHADWTKVKCGGREEFVVGGWARRHGQLASLLLGRPDGEGLRYVGRVGTGLSDEDRGELRRLLDARATEAPPFLDAPDDPEACWARPDLLVEVRYGGWTHDGRLRHAVYLGRREDKPPPPLVLPRVRLTNPDRVLFPDVGLTKRDLALHYARVAHLLLPEIVDRRLTLVRCPNGVEGGCFHQKHHHHLPDAVVRVPSAEPDEPPDVAIRDAEGLFALVQHGVIELHPSGARTDRPDRPDRLVFDLDPDEALAWEDVVRAAHDVRAYLEALGLRSFARTTGGKGLHVVVPIARRTSWDDVRAFTRGVAETLARREPDRFVPTMSKARRKGRIFVDWLRNTPGATAVGSWVVRARPGAPVSVPVPWARLDEAPAGGWRVEDLVVPETDPWSELAEVRQRLTHAMLESVRADEAGG